ncbi:MULTISPECIES: OsmC family protein [unclassified Mycobacterium]|uniref:OsmC family protein n=1 Tax=unclassified Mycobacterium TaxID=2642494 RepID=UPI00048BAD88|nr:MULTISPECIES: OsmC family protein [unclassified Mycobacterium]SEB25335.1 putative redox protein [Mycobacterium sp. 283mftsu]
MTTPQPGQAPTSPEGTVTVAENGAGKYTQEIIAGGHRLIADEPRPFGDDAGPSPYDLLLSALGACTSMTIRMYADKKGLPLEQVRVSLRHSRIHAKDCAECETQQGMVDHIDRDIELIGDLDDEQREKLLAIAERCPVHRTLTSSVHVSTSLRPTSSLPA